MDENWLKASELEKEGRIEEALKLYLEIAETAEEAVAAVSLLSAAKCAVRLGRMNEAMELFKKAGAKYEQLADEMGASSPNLSEWAYGIALKCYQLAGDRSSSENVLKKTGNKI